MDLGGQTGPGPAGWTNIAQTPRHMDNSHLAGHRQCPPAPQPLHNTPEMPIFTPKAPLRNQQGQTLSLCPSNPHLSKPHLCPRSVHPSHLTCTSMEKGGSPRPHPDPPQWDLGDRCGVSLARLPTPTFILGHQQHLFVQILPQNRLCSASHPQPMGAG